MGNPSSHQPTSGWSFQLEGPRSLVPISLGPEDLRIQSGEVLVRFRAGAICGSDMPFWNFDFSPGPALEQDHRAMPLHEIVGEVVDAGDTDLRVGDRVVGWALRSKGLAEFVVVNAAHAHPVDDLLDDVDAVVAQPLACVLYAVERIGDVTDRRVAVIGQGPIGLLFSHVLKQAGAAHVTAVDLIDRSAVAAAFGVDAMVHDSSNHWSHSVRDDELFDVVVEAIGHQVGTLNDAVRVLATQGLIYAFGVPQDSHYPVDFMKLFRKSGTLRCGVTFDHRQKLGEALDYLREHRELLRDYVTHRYPISNAASAFATAASAAPDRIKVALVAD